MPNPTIDSGHFSRGGTSEVTLDQFNQQLRSSPLWATWMAQNGIRTDRPIKLSKNQQKAFAAFLQQNGVPIQKDFHIDEAGNLNQKSRTGRNLKIAAIAGGVALGGLGLAGIGPLAALGGSSAGAAGVAGSAPTLGGGATLAGNLAGAGALGAGGSAAGTVGLGALGAGAGAAGTAAGTSAATAAGHAGLWGKIGGLAVEQGIPAAANIIGTKMQVNAERDAAKMQADAAREALDWQKEQYAQRQRQLAPAIGVGNGATVRLGELMGIQTPQGGYGPQTQTGVHGQPTNPAPTAQQPATINMVPMRAPTGAVKMIPEAQVPHYEQLGAVRVS